MVDSLKLKEVLVKYVRDILPEEWSNVPVKVKYSEGDEEYPFIIVELGDEQYIINEDNGLLSYNMITEEETYLELFIIPVLIGINSVNDDEANSILEKLVDRIKSSWTIKSSSDIGRIARDEISFQRAREKTESSKEPIFIATINMAIRLSRHNKKGGIFHKNDQRKEEGETVKKKNDNH